MRRPQTPHVQQTNKTATMDGTDNHPADPALLLPPQQHPPRPMVERNVVVLLRCGTAFALWFAFYAVLVAHCFVIWKWDSSRPPVVSSLVGPIGDLTAAIARSAQRIDDREEQLSAMGRLVRRLSDKIAALQPSEPEQQGARWGGVIPPTPKDAVAAAVAATPPEEPSLLRLKQLLQIQDIVEYRSASKAIAMAIQELKNYLAGETMAADRFASVPHLHAVLVTAATTMSYQSISFCDADAAAGLSAAQIAAATPVVAAGTAKQQPDPFLPMVQSTATMESLLETLRVAMAQAKAAAADNNNNNAQQRPSCLSSLKRPVDWLEIGLAAWHQHHDSEAVRQALLDVIRQEDGFTDVILDADADLLSLSSSILTNNRRRLEDGAKRKRPVTEVPLRDVLDTPSLHVLALYLDGLLDLVGGRNDWFDNLMDRHVYSALTSDDDSVGQYAVDRMLNVSGGWTIQPLVDQMHSWTRWMMSLVNR
jgi:hypothetical protein